MLPHPGSLKLKPQHNCTECDTFCVVLTEDPWFANETWEQRKERVPALVMGTITLGPVGIPLTQATDLKLLRELALLQGTIFDTKLILPFASVQGSWCLAIEFLSHASHVHRPILPSP